MSPSGPDASSRLRAVVFGEAVIDVFSDRRVIAGAPLHVSVHLASRGWHVFFITRVGKDEDGDRITKLLEGRGVDCSLREIDPELPTGAVTVDVDEADHSFTIHEPAAFDRIEGPPRLPPHDAFCYGTLAARSRRSRQSLTRLRRSSTCPYKLFDPNLRPPHVSAEAVREGLRAATVAKLNEEEFSACARIAGFVPSPPGYFDFAPALRWLCVTRGRQGAELWDRAGNRWAVPSNEVAVVDSVGAGDAFAAALLDGVVRENDPAHALRAASVTAESVLTHTGGLPHGGS